MLFVAVFLSATNAIVAAASIIHREWCFRRSNGGRW
jgi:hypothetical protein